jgi:hypothetical protein
MDSASGGAIGLSIESNCRLVMAGHSKNPQGHNKMAVYTWICIFEGHRNSQNELPSLPVLLILVVKMASAANSMNSDEVNEHTSLLDGKKDKNKLSQSGTPVRTNQRFFNSFVGMCSALLLILFVAFLSYEGSGAASKSSSFTAANEYGAFGEK